MRLFTAIDLPEEIRNRLVDVITQLRPLARLTWSRAENLHITTKFVGQWPEERLADLNSTLAALPRRHRIPIHAHGLGFYPGAKSPRVFWAGVENPPELTALASDTDQALAKLGIEPENRRYSPHLTLARIKEPSGLQAFHKAVEKLGQPEFGSFEADRFFLYLSKPGPGGSVYTKLSEFPFSPK